MRFCSQDYPIWAAAQADGGKWNQIKPDGDGVFRVAIGAGGGIALVTPAKDLVVTYASVDELSGMFAACQTPVGVKTIRGDVAGLDNEGARISLGSAQSGISDLNQFELRQVESGPRDLVASRFGDIHSYAVSSLVIRRSVNVADGTKLPTIDFHSAEAFAPASATLTLQSFGSLSEVWLDFLAANGSRHGIYYVPQGSARQTYVGVPPSRLAAGDVQLLEATDDVGPPLNAAFRFISAAVTGVVDQTLTFGPPVPQPTVSDIAGSGKKRWRALVPVQSEYSSFVRVGFSDRTGQNVSIAGVGAYIPKTGSNWDLAIPDFSSLDFDSSYGLQPEPSPEWRVLAAGGGSLLSNRTPGSVIRGSVRQGFVYEGIAGRSLSRSSSMRDLITRAGFRNSR